MCFESVATSAFNQTFLCATHADKLSWPTKNFPSEVMAMHRTQAVWPVWVFSVPFLPPGIMCSFLLLSRHPDKQTNKPYKQTSKQKPEKMEDSATLKNNCSYQKQKQLSTACKFQLHSHLIMEPSLEALNAVLLSGEMTAQVTGSWWPRKARTAMRSGQEYWKWKSNQDHQYTLIKPLASKAFKGGIKSGKKLGIHIHT